MKDIEYIIGIYHSALSGELEGGDAHHHLLYLFSDQGLFEKEGAQKLFDERFNSPQAIDFKKFPQAIGPFVSLEQLNQYAFALCEEVNAHKISLLSVQEYNELLENSQLASDFYGQLLEKGSVIENIERKKKGFLSRLFH